MQTFKDSITNKVWQFEDDVEVINTSGIYSFKTVLGAPLNSMPTTLQPYVIPAPTPAQLLLQAQQTQVALLQASYKNAINTPVTFKNAAGVTSTYASGDMVAINGKTATVNLNNCIVSGAAAWKIGKWLDTNNIAQTFTYADLQGLAGAMEAVAVLDWQDLIMKIAEVQAATTVSAVQAIVF